MANWQSPAGGGAHINQAAKVLRQSSYHVARRRYPNDDEI